MIWVIVPVVLVIAVLLCLVTLIQLLYMESLRIRARDLPALQFFKETLEDRIGAPANQGALAFSLVKHTCLLLLGLLFLTARFGERAPVWQLFLETAALAWLAMLLCTYVLPQMLYRKTSGKWLLSIAPFLRGLTLAVKPVTAILGFFQSLVELAQQDESREEPPHPSENIEALITAGTEEGLIEEDDRKLIQSVVAFGDKTVREVMTSRPNIVGIAADRPLEDLRDLAINEQYSRVPVFDGTIDQIVGFVHVRDMFELNEAERHKRKVRDLVRPIRYVPETKPVNDLLREMQGDATHMVIVVDEYGNTAGLATMEDLVEEILGEIHDEHEPERDFTKEADGAYIVSGGLDVDRLYDLVNFRPQEETESTTVGGLVTEWLGHVPHVDETVERDGIKIEVLAGNDLRVERVRVSRAVKDERAVY